MKILVAGDWHGNAPWATRVIEFAAESQYDAIFQLGDFGWWPHVDWGQRYIDRVSETAMKVEMPIYWCDGNHDNHEDLLQHSSSATRVSVREALHYVPRGTAWQWEGVRFVALGGAYSIDKDRRIPGYSWWEDEMIRERDVERTLQAESCDILFTHDAPYRAVGKPLYKDDANTDANNAAVRAVMEALQPDWLFHGHWHEYKYHEMPVPVGVDDFMTDFRITRVVGLGMDGDPYNAISLTVDNGLATVKLPVDEPILDLRVSL
jgi:predicted phosphodiesterase